MDLLTVVSNFIQHQRLLETGATVVVGVSGGSDSLCLLFLLRQLQSDLRLSLHVAHLHHCLRGSEADEDMIFVALRAAEWGLPCTIKVVNVTEIAEREHLSIEEAARLVRYGFLADVAHQVRATAVAVGHNADDQTETVLMHFLRGAGLAGLRGMQPATGLGGLLPARDDESSPAQLERPKLIRPLLTVPRNEIERYCQAHHLEPRFDRSNLDPAHFRNRLRHELIPILETYNPNIRTLLLQFASLAAADYAFVSSACDQAWPDLITDDRKHAIGFDLAAWRRIPLALKRETLRRAIRQLRPRLRDIDFVHIKQAVELAAGGSTGAQTTLPQGVRLAVDYETLRLSLDDSAPPVPDWALLWQDEPIPVQVPGRTPLPARQTSDLRPAGDPRGVGAGHRKWTLEACMWEGEPTAVLSNSDRWTAYLDAEQLGPNVTLRRRRPGDRFQPLGMGSRTVEVTDFMINAKIPRRWRDHIPILVHAESVSAPKEAIAWIAGWRIDERVKVHAHTKRTVRLRWLHDPA